VVVIALGVLGAQAGLDAYPDEAIEVMRVNLLGAGSMLLECLRQLRRRGAGALVLLSSVAVERPRASNPIYGAAKAGLDALRPGSLRRDRVERGARARRRPGIRQDPNDRRPGARPVRDHPRGRRVGDGRCSARTRWNDLGARTAQADVRDPAPPAAQRLSEASAVRRKVLLVDVGIAIVAAIIVLTITPGLAVASMIAIAVLATCAISFSRESRRRRRAEHARRIARVARRRQPHLSRN
jgi:hypothetical protein